jgi:hypothetical protein
MSEGNVEIWRASIKGQLAALSAGTSPEATISGMAEIWDPEIELDASRSFGALLRNGRGCDRRTSAMTTLSARAPTLRARDTQVRARL